MGKERAITGKVGVWWDCPLHPRLHRSLGCDPGHLEVAMNILDYHNGVIGQGCGGKYQCKKGSPG